MAAGILNQTPRHTLQEVGLQSLGLIGHRVARRRFEHDRMSPCAPLEKFWVDFSETELLGFAPVGV
jgi:hypothetical protein